MFSAVVDLSKKVFISVGSYGSNNIYLVKKNDSQAIVFESPKIVAIRQRPHRMGEAYLSYSPDEGKIWAGPLRMAEKGNLLSAVFDKHDNIHCIYSEFSNNTFSVNDTMMDSACQVF